MKAITLWQPWATLIACGAKHYETRSWPTSYRGPIAIHAATKPAPKTFSTIIPYETSKAMFEHLMPLGIYFPADLPHGAIVATAELVNCVPTGRKPGPGFQERQFGDWTPGRYAWELANVKMLPKPIPAKGAQGLWDWNGPTHL
ncbi:MAG: ASCH domain protein [Firmicutes bacterium ADurb.Bin506]|nr:MAG: ASCH domain protein [Firmicutes bacterium ADurb.Bin506]